MALASPAWRSPTPRLMRAVEKALGRSPAQQKSSQPCAAHKTPPPSGSR
eukprot:CAMPEP_0176285572 /NCGR_PEP_ID=MMETSP0121_2-20121125/52440_1 /TAXON_ID=160619 /ORGANISM="Kryptoperidinium foliaceum, Strain CCMP 1326" /LENGTH=48 /DNA_ID= /DNA_START= /DNA_END= /DNA_ORIENTATION=